MYKIANRVSLMINYAGPMVQNTTLVKIETPRWGIGVKGWEPVAGSAHLLYFSIFIGSF
jgi:hypothetical protein